MPFQNLISGQYEGWTRLELIQMVLRGLHQPVATPGTDTTSDYNRYPKQDVINQLIMAEIEFAKIAKFNTTFAVVEAVASQSTYRLPNNHLETLSCKYYRNTTDYDEPVILNDMNALRRKSRKYRTDAVSNRVDFYAPSYKHGNVRSFMAYPRPSTAGTTYDGSSMGIVTSVTDFSFNGNITGTHKTGYADSAFLVDSAGRDFTTLGVVVGMMVFNTTDGSGGQITAIGNQDATNDKITVTLSGGTDDDFDVGDSFVIAVGEYGVVIRANGTMEWAFSSQYGALQDINPLSGNFLLDYVRMPQKLDYDTQIPETPKEYQELLVERAIWKLGNTEYDGKSQQKRAGQAKEAWEDGIMIFRTLDEDATATNQVDDREANFFGEYGGFLLD
jgi:hypothetical protein